MISKTIDNMLSLQQYLEILIINYHVRQDSKNKTSISEDNDRFRPLDAQVAHYYCEKQE